MQQIWHRKIYKLFFNGPFPSHNCSNNLNCLFTGGFLGLSYVMKEHRKQSIAFALVKESYKRLLARGDQMMAEMRSTEAGSMYEDMKPADGRSQIIAIY